MGRLSALILHRQGYRITLFDKDDKSGQQSAAYAAAGLLTPLGESLHCQANIVKMGMESLTLWPQILAELSEYTYFQQQGALMVSHEQDKTDYQHFAHHLAHHYPQYPVQSLNRSQLQVLEPELGRSFHQGLYLPQEGQIGNRKLLLALQHELEQENITWHTQCPIDDIGLHPEHCRIHYRQHKQHFDLVIDCRGLGAKKRTTSQACDLINLRGVRGELFQLLAPDVTINRPIRLMHPRYQLYVAPKGKGFYVVGATEIESEDQGPMTVRSSLELLSAAYSLHPGFAEAQIRQHVSQCRPAFEDNQPKILARQRLIQINGLYRHGFLIAPVLLKQLTALVDCYADASCSKSFFSVSKPEPLCSLTHLPYSDLLPISSHDNENIY